MVIGGYTKNDDSNKLFSALLVGVYENGKLRYTGKIGTGFNDQVQRDMIATFKKYIIKRYRILINRPGSGTTRPMQQLPG